MRYPKYILFLVGLVFAIPFDQAVIKRIPNEIEAASIARTLVNRESLANVNTVKTIHGSDNTLRSIPVSSMEYYADCDNDGNPYWLVVNIGSTYQNILRGSEYSFTIRVGDHPINADVNPNYPGGITTSPAGSPRATFEGKLHNVTFENPVDLINLEKCFLKKHPDSKYWMPGSLLSPHGSHWVKFEVEEIYFIGGFGDRAFIGSIDAALYHSVGIISN